MAHLTLQLGAALVVPFGDIRKQRRSRCPRETELRLAAAAEAGLPVLRGRFSRYAHAYLLPPATDRAGGPLAGMET